MIRNVERFRPLRDTIFVTDLESGPSLTKAGIIIPDDNMRESGIRNRWGKVWAIGPKVDRDQLRPGDWILIKHGRWTQAIDLDLPNGTLRVWRVDNDAVEIACDECPLDRVKTKL